MYGVGGEVQVGAGVGYDGGRLDLQEAFGAEPGAYGVGDAHAVAEASRGAVEGETSGLGAGGEGVAGGASDALDAEALARGVEAYGDEVAGAEVARAYVGVGGELQGVGRAVDEEAEAFGGGRREEPPVEPSGHRGG